MSGTEQAENSNVPLADMIESLRYELESAQRKGMNRVVAFGVEKVELELKVVLSRKVKGGGGIKFWVISAEGSAEGGNEATHSFKLTLSPLDAETKGRLQVANEVETPPDTTR
jgi:hypothetical protein